MDKKVLIARQGMSSLRNEQFEKQVKLYQLTPEQADFGKCLKMYRLSREQEKVGNKMRR